MSRNQSHVAMHPHNRRAEAMSAEIEAFLFAIGTASSWEVCYIEMIDVDLNQNDSIIDRSMGMKSCT